MRSAGVSKPIAWRTWRGADASTVSRERLSILRVGALCRARDEGNPTRVPFFKSAGEEFVHGQTISH